MKSITVLSRHKFFNYLTVLFSGVTLPSYAFVGAPPNIDKIVNKQNYENQTTAVLLDLATNKILESHN